MTGPMGPRGPQGERGFVGVPDDKDIKNWLVGASSDPETRQMLATVLADIVGTDPRVEQLIQRLEALENRRGEVISGGQLEEIEQRLESRIVPVIVRNADGSTYSEAPQRQAFDPIVINLAEPQK